MTFTSRMRGGFPGCAAVACEVQQFGPEGSPEPGYCGLREVERAPSLASSVVAGETDDLRDPGPGLRGADSDVEQGDLGRSPCAAPRHHRQEQLDRILAALDEAPGNPSVQSDL